MGMDDWLIDFLIKWMMLVEDLFIISPDESRGYIGFRSVAPPPPP